MKRAGSCSYVNHCSLMFVAGSVNTEIFDPLPWHL